MKLFLCILIPLLGAFRVNFVGELTFADPFVVIYSLFSLGRLRSVLSVPIAKRISVLLAASLVALILSDIYRGTLWVDFLRGWSRLPILIASFWTCALIIETNITRAAVMIFAMMCQPLLNYIVYRPDLPFYKFVLGFFVSASAFWLSYVFRGDRRLWPVVFPIGAGVLALLADCRSLAGITLCAAAYNMLLSLKLLGEERGWKSRMLFGLFWIALSMSLVQIYSYLAASGRLSEDALAKYESQVDDRGKFSVLSGRWEPFFSIPKIVQSPLIGWGSWVKDPVYIMERAEALGMDPYRTLIGSDGLIPAHSHLLGALLEAGVFGGAIWIYVLYYAFRIFASGWLRSTGPWSGLLGYMLILFIWDIIFSPFGGERRVNDGLYLWIVALIATVSLARHNGRFAPNQHTSLPSLKGVGVRGAGLPSLTAR